MSLLLTVILILVICNLVGGYAVPTFRTGNYYGPSWGVIILIIVIMYLLGYR